MYMGVSNYIGLSPSPLDMHIYVFECIYAHPNPVKNGINDCTHPSIGSTGLIPLLPKFPTPRHRPSNISRQWEGMEGFIDGNMGNDGKRMEIVSLLSLLILLPHVFAACMKISQPLFNWFFPPSQLLDTFFFCLSCGGGESHFDWDAEVQKYLAVSKVSL